MSGEPRGKLLRDMVEAFKVSGLARFQMLELADSCDALDAQTVLQDAMVTTLEAQVRELEAALKQIEKSVYIDTAKRIARTALNRQVKS